MKLVFLMSSLILAATTVVTDSPKEEPDEFPSFNSTPILNERMHLESVVFHNPDIAEIAVEDIHVLEIEEEICLGFDTSKYLPDNFNPLKGKHDINWHDIELIELEEDVDLGFDSNQYLPSGFNPYNGMTKKLTCIK